jgi:hypothetical protein
MTHYILRSLLLLAPILLTSCGGGSEQPIPETTFLIIESLGLTRTTFQGEGQPPSNSYSKPEGYIFVRPIGSTPPATVYVNVNDTGDAFGSSVIEHRANQSETVTVHLNPNLQPGTYTGFLTIRVCRSSSCADEFQVDGGIFPYTVTVRPLLTVTVLVNNQIVDSLQSWIGSTRNIYQAANKKIEFQGSTPIEVRFVNQPGYYELVKDEAASSETKWVGFLSVKPIRSGSIYVEIYPDRNTYSPQQPYMFGFGFL